MGKRSKQNDFGTKGQVISGRSLAKSGVVLLGDLASYAGHLRTAAAVRDPVRRSASVLDVIDDVMARIARSRDAIVTSVVAVGDLTPREQRALATIARELGEFRPLSPVSRAKVLRQHLAEDRYHGPKVAEIKRAERHSAVRIADDAGKVTTVAIGFAEKLESVRMRIETELRKAYGRGGRPPGRSISRASVARKYRELGRTHERVTAMMVAEELGVSDDTVRRVAGPWPPSV
jgi:hypothetical protein